MYRNRKIGVTVPAHNEEAFIQGVLRGLPDFVDCIVAVNDASTDRTLEIMAGEAGLNRRVKVVNRERQGGVGAAIMTGHRRGLEEGMDVLVVVAGDGQMDPTFLTRMIDPIVERRADYAKGNRLGSSRDRRGMPTMRMLGNLVLTTLTKIASGYWRVSDPQNGYTAISADVLRKLRTDRIENGFAFENDMLVKLNVIGARVVDVEHPSLYQGQKSKIRYSKFIVRTGWILVKDTVWRIWAKYGWRNGKSHAPSLHGARHAYPEK